MEFRTTLGQTPRDARSHGNHSRGRIGACQNRKPVGAQSSPRFLFYLLLALLATCSTCYSISRSASYTTFHSISGIMKHRQIQLIAIFGALVAATTAYLVWAPSPAERLAAALDEKRWADAEALAREALRRAPADEKADLLRALGRAHGRQQEHTHALEAYRAATALRPEDPDLRHRVAIERVRIGEGKEAREEYGKALADYRDAVELAPEIPHGHHALIRILEAEYGIGETLAALEVAARNIPQDAALRLKLAWYLASHPDPEMRDATRGAELAYDVLLHDRTPETLDTYAVTLAALGKFQRAIAAELDAIELAGGEEAPFFEERKRRVGGFTRGEPYVETRRNHRREPDSD